MMTAEAKSMWEIKPLGDCLIFISRGVAPKYVSDSPIAALNQKSIRWGYIEKNYLKYHDPEKRVKPEVFIRQRDIVVNSTGDITIGRAYYFSNPWPNLFADSHVTILRLNSDILLPEFCIYLFPLPEYQNKIYGLVTGATGQLELSKSNLSKLEVVVPTLPTQRKIAAILSVYDDLIENNLQRIKILEEMAQNLYREWFVKFRFPGHQQARFTDSSLGRIPVGWEVKAMPDAVTVRPALPVPKNGEIPFVSMGSLSMDSMLIGEIEYRLKASGARFQNGDTLFARITPCLENGKTGFVQFLPNDDNVACGSTEFIVLRSKTLCQEYVYLMARSELFRDNAIKSMSGATGRQRVREECFNQFFLAHPPDAILEEFQMNTRPQFELIFSLNYQNQNLRRTRDLLLPKLISGELDVSELDICSSEEIV